jgi:rhodanese-related sulfurtransferase
MSPLIPIDAKSLARRLEAGDVTLIDIREPGEFASEHIQGAACAPLSRLNSGEVSVRSANTVVFTCKTGMRTNANCSQLAACVGEPAYVLEGGLEAWKKAGFATARLRRG